MGTFHDYAINQVQKFHSIQGRKLAMYLRRDPHWYYVNEWFPRRIVPFIRDTNVFVHAFNLAGDALTIQGWRAPRTSRSVNSARTKLIRESFIAIYKMAPEEAMELGTSSLPPLKFLYEVNAK